MIVEHNMARRMWIVGLGVVTNQPWARFAVGVREVCFLSPFTSLFYLCECWYGYNITEGMIITMSVVRLLRCRQLLLGFELLP
jgi:hypothetical protein